MNAALAFFALALLAPISPEMAAGIRRTRDRAQRWLDDLYGTNDERTSA